MSARRLLSAATVAAAVLTPGVARGTPVSGPHEVVEITTTTERPNASAGFGYSATYHGGTLRRLVIELPRGTRVDTGVPSQCTASDAEIMLIGESACPPSARIGSGQVTVEQFGLSQATYNSALYNAPGQQLELIESGPRVIGVAHTYINGTTLDGPVQTCANGGQPPSGCPFDEIVLRSNHLQTVPVTVGGHNYGTTPPSCPRSAAWTGGIRFYYADGSLDRLTYHVPCLPPKNARAR